MFYRLIGMAVWKLAVAYIRHTYRRRLRSAVSLAVVGVAVAGYLAARSRD